MIAIWQYYVITSSVFSLIRYQDWLLFAVSGEDLVPEQEIKVQEADEGWTRSQLSSGRPRPASAWRISPTQRRWRLSNRNGRTRDSNLSSPAQSSNEGPVPSSPPPRLPPSSRLQPPHHALPRSSRGDVPAPPHGPHPPCLHVPVARLSLTSQHAAGYQAATHDAPHTNISNAHGVPQLLMVPVWRQHEPAPRPPHIIWPQCVVVSVSVIVVLDRTWAKVAFSLHSEDDMSASDLSLLPKQRHHQLRGNEVTLHLFPLCRKLNEIYQIFQPISASLAT